MAVFVREWAYEADHSPPRRLAVSAELAAPRPGSDRPAVGGVAAPTRGRQRGGALAPGVRLCLRWALPPGHRHLGPRGGGRPALGSRPLLSVARRRRLVRSPAGTTTGKAGGAAVGAV